MSLPGWHLPAWSPDQDSSSLFLPRCSYCEKIDPLLDGLVVKGLDSLSAGMEEEVHIIRVLVGHLDSHLSPAVDVEVGDIERIAV